MHQLSCVLRSSLLSLMAQAASSACGKALLPSSTHSELVCTEQSELPNDSYMLTFELKLCTPEESGPRKTSNIATPVTTHSKSQLWPLAPSWHPQLAPAPAPIMQLPLWQRPETPQMAPCADGAPVYSYPQTVQDSMHRPYQQHYYLGQPASNGWHPRSPSPTKSTPSPPCVPSHRKDTIRRTVPQQGWDPYAHGRCHENAREVVIHHFPTGVTPQDTMRIAFDLRGMRPGTGIPLSHLTAARIDNTMRFLADAHAPAYVYRQVWKECMPTVASDDLYSYLELCMSVRPSCALGSARYSWSRTHSGQLTLRCRGSISAGKCSFAMPTVLAPEARASAPSRRAS